MANEQSNQLASRNEQSASKQEPSIQQSPERPVTRGRLPTQGGPTSLMRRMSEDLDRLFGEFFGFEPFSSELTNNTRWPQIEVSHRENKLIVRADLPGLDKDDVDVEVRDDELRISGERRVQSEQRQPGGFYRSERSYGSFYRALPLPPGAKAETAAATFDKGVLEVEIEVPEQSPRGKKIEIREQSH
jgi:HSP20 family protein